MSPRLIAVTAAEELYGTFGPGELARDLADRGVLRQRPNWATGSLACSSGMPMGLPSAESVTISFGAGIAHFLERIDHDVPRMRRVDGNQCFPDRESRARTREPDLHHRRGAFRDQQVAKQVAVAFRERDRLEVPLVVARP